MRIAGVNSLGFFLFYNFLFLKLLCVYRNEKQKNIFYKYTKMRNKIFICVQERETAK